MLKINNKTITMTRGDTAKITVSITTSDGSPYIPQAGDSIRFAVKKRYTDEEVLINKDIPIDTLLLVIEPEDTKPLRFGSYKYDIQITMADGTIDTFIDRADFVLTEEIV